MCSSAVDVSDTEIDVLLNIIQLDILKIREYVDYLREVKVTFEEPIAAIESRILEFSSQTTLPPPQEFLDWFKHIFSIRDLPVDVGPEVLLEYIMWAQKAKKDYLGFLKAAFSARDQSLPRWIYTIFKLGRYGVASRALLQLPSEFPVLFNPMTVEPLLAPRKTRFSTRAEEMPLTCVLRRVVESRAEEFKPRLARVWNTTDAEALFRKSCTFDLVVHAELQLLNFYDHNP